MESWNIIRIPPYDNQYFYEANGGLIGTLNGWNTAPPGLMALSAAMAFWEERR
jgi:hypothetical protein